MKNKFLLIAVAILLLLQALLCAADQKNTTGKDWLGMINQEKVTYIIIAIQVLQQKGIPFSRAPSVYITMLDNRLTGRPELASTEVTDILTSLVYEKEPGAREALDRIKRQAVRGDEK